ncbi:alpha/beta-hydrolase [Mollisia scopiformis]|uniref:Alpha/beta-hydrolase n=1 Tax=Mollisia scopiformis TaxID=149040 RepID=A0A194WV45_MOLSC|nr:alpha/beta-hydrolase [Mollisia scopiformis]KUJ11845.1 alpha/beta-hydrolase [Mollisia scopiformis]
MRFSSLFVNAAFLEVGLAASTTVRKVDTSPTGYVVDFVFTPNATTHPKSVLLGFPLYSDSLHASPSITDGYSPWDWKPEYFSLALFTNTGSPATLAGLDMTYNPSSGDWELSVPFPSGTFNYNFYPDCNSTDYLNCAALTDSSNPPLEPYPGDQLVSTIQVPFDGKYQVRDYDWQLPLPNESRRGNFSFQQYPSPGSTYPSKDIHDVGIYLPNEYGTIPGKKYPVLYLSHGGGGTDADWFNQGRAQNILDRLIDCGEVDPMIVVTPNFYNLGFTMQQDATNGTIEGFDVVGLNGFFNAIRENYLTNLIPWVESTYAVNSTPSSRAFAGLSLGGGLTLSMLFNATSTFSSYCIMSNTPSPEPDDPIWNQTSLRSVGIFAGAGFYDAAFENSRNFQTRASAVDLAYLSHYPMYSAHQWATWQEILYVYLRRVIWRDVPYGVDT